MAKTGTEARLAKNELEADLRELITEFERKYALKVDGIHITRINTPTHGPSTFEDEILGVDAIITI